MTSHNVKTTHLLSLKKIKEYENSKILQIHFTNFNASYEYYLKPSGR
jgi:hypothetical protein